MVCKNCGADLKPGIKYCLECGNYIEDDDTSSIASENGMMNGTGKSYQLRTARRKKKKRLRPVDILIYAGLSIIIIVSFIIIIYTLLTPQGDEIITDPPVVTGDVTITVDDCVLTIPRSLSYDIQGSTLFLSDNMNFTLSYKNTTDDYDLYAKDLSILTNDLTENNYEVLSVGKRDANGVEFIICEIRVNGRVKYLYLTKFGKYTTMGVIDPFESGVWEEALNVIADLNNSATLDSAYSNTYNDYSTTSSSQTTSSYEGQSSDGYSTAELPQNGNSASSEGNTSEQGQ